MELDGEAAKDEKELTDLIGKYEGLVTRDDQRAALANVKTVLQALSWGLPRAARSQQEGKPVEAETQSLAAGKVAPNRSQPSPTSTIASKT